MIEIRGLTPKQVAFCDIMWNLDSKDRVERFIRSLPRADQLECRVLVELMMLSFLDEVTDLSDAAELIKKVSQ